MTSCSFSGRRCSCRCLRRSFSRLFRSSQETTVNWMEMRNRSVTRSDGFVSAQSLISLCAGKLYPPCVLSTSCLSHTGLPRCLCFQVLPGHDEGYLLQLHVLVCPHHHLHHWDNQVRIQGKGLCSHLSKFRFRVKPQNLGQRRHLKINNRKKYPEKRLCPY